MLQEIYYQSSNDQLCLEVVRDGIQVIPDFYNATIYGLAGEELETAANLTPASDGKCYYSPSLASTQWLGTNYRIDWDVSFNGQIETITQLFQVVKTKMHPFVTDDDLIDECSALQQENAVIRNGTADSGTANSVTVNQMIGQEENTWRGGVIRFISGANTGQTRVVSASTRAGVISWDTALAQAVAQGDEFIIQKSFKAEIDRAWLTIIEYIDNGEGFRPALILNPEVFKTAHVYLALEKVCRAMSDAVTDIWWARAQYYGKLGNSNLHGVRLIYDTWQSKYPTNQRGTSIFGFRR